MNKILRWSSAFGLSIIGIYLLYKGNWEAALTALVLPLLITLLPLLYQNKQQIENVTPSLTFSFFSNGTYLKQYTTLLRYQNRDFDIKGLSTQTEHTLELEQVFVELKLQSQAAHKTTADPLQNLSSKSRSDSYAIWHFFSLLSENENNPNPKLVIVGPPGSGKTTLLRHMTLLFTSNSKEKEIKKIRSSKIPFLLFLRDYVDEISDNPEIVLPKIIEASIRKFDLNIPQDWFSRKVRNGECLVLLDGLDEVADPALRRKVVNWLEKQIHTYPKNAFIITSRPHGYKENPITGVSVLEVMPFNRDQIDRFVQKWYLANEVKSHDMDDMGVRMTAKSGADDLLRRLEKNPTLMELAVNPLLLTMIATVHRYRSALPGRRVELYKEICEVFLGKRQESKGISLDLVPAQKQSVLQSLAYEMMCGNIREIRKADAIEIVAMPLLLVAPNTPPEMFLKSIEQTSGLLLERELDIYSFAHKTFQEYLASVYILEKKNEEGLYNHINDDWWHEVIKLYSAQTDATTIITSCLDQDPPSSMALSLAIQCLDEAHQVQPRLREIANRILFENAEDEDPDIRTIIGQALLSYRIKHLSALSPSVFVDTEFLTNAEYQIFVDDMDRQGNGDFSPVHWEQKRFAPGSAHTPVTGLAPVDVLTFCEWLTDLHTGSGEWFFRLPVRDEVTRNQYKKPLGFWLFEKNDDNDLKVGRSIGMWRNPDASWPSIPDQFLKNMAQEDIKLIISILRIDGASSKWLQGESYYNLSIAIKKLAKSVKNSGQLLSETADLLYTGIIRQPLSRAVDFGYGVSGLNAYDQSISDRIEKTSNKDFGHGMLYAIKCFSDFFQYGMKPLDRLRSLFVAFAFTFLITWFEKNKSLFLKTNDENIQKKIDYLIDIYVDDVVIEARKRGLVHPFEGLLLVKEIKKDDISK